MSALVKTYVDLILYRGWTIDRIPPKYRDEVQAELDKLNNPETNNG